ncbi:hypothetical protein HG15A2_41760 [Adhaeretor mobilis]|uniref:Uncharacterized protein n=1 Tax=Adhaeretor mobilis TaxID=1930276 RepID=A0A517N132_9BACT|nr:hypothetical protein HG15A2_41760 [Adhaeretor mobilis]
MMCPAGSLAEDDILAYLIIAGAGPVSRCFGGPWKSKATLITK